jgi:endonuclease G
MKKLLFFIIPFILFAFTSKYLPNYDIDIYCDKLLHKRAFDICYSCRLKHPLAIVYKVDGSLIDKYNYSRKHLRFRPDDNLPKKCRAYPKDISKTGYDHGHVAHNAIFDYNRAIQKETFLMSNIAPQAKWFNRNLWKRIERFEQIEARKYKDIRVITGVCGSRGNLGRKRHYVNIPAYFYKIIFLPNGKIISFLVPNTNIVAKDKAKKYLVLLKKIEKICKIKIDKKRSINDNIFRKKRRI